MKSAVLVHLLGWCSERTSFELGGGVSLCRTDGSDVEKLYLHLCRTQNVDQGEPFHFPSHILLSEEAHDELFPYWGGPFSVVSRVCNVITVCTSNPFGMCRLISSSDDFQTAWIPSSVIYEQNPDLEILRAYPDFLKVSADSVMTMGEHFPRLDDAALNGIKTCWSNQLKLLSSRETDNHRIDNALSYFFYSWRSYYVEHMCLNLAVVLESLFSPSSQQELSHQIAFNVSRFCGQTPEERAVTYKTTKRFYAVRSQIVHGGKAKHYDLYTLTPEVFHLCARILKAILSDYALALRFCQEEKRRAYFKEWLFGKND